MKERFRQYRPAIAAFLPMMAMALTSSTLSFFLEPICEALQISRGSFSVIFSLMSVAGALLNPFVGQYVGKRGVRGVLLLSGVWGCVCMILLSLSTRLWMLYVTSFCLGLFGSTCVSLCGNVIVQQSYFGPQSSGILGAVMAGSGVGGMLFSLLIPAVMGAFGWQKALWVMGVLWLTLLWGGGFLLEKQTVQTGKSGAGAVGLGMTRAEALRSPKLYLQMVVIVVISAACGAQQQLPSLLASYGYEPGTVSVMISVMTAVLALGKVAQGLLYGKLGIKQGGLLMMLVFAASYLVLLVPALAYPGLILIALGFGIYTTLLPQVTRRAFGSREYASIWALIATVGSVGTFVGTPLWGLVYDLTGAYTLGLLVMPVLLLIATAALMAMLKDTQY